MTVLCLYYLGEAVFTEELPHRAEAKVVLLLSNIGRTTVLFLLHGQVDDSPLSGAFMRHVDRLKHLLGRTEEASLRGCLAAMIDGLVGSVELVQGVLSLEDQCE